MYFCLFLCQALAEAQKGKEQALVDSVSLDIPSQWWI